MKALERIFLYTVLAILVFYVFLVDGNVESKVAIQEEIRARSVVIVNDAGQGVIELTHDENNGVVIIYNKDGTPAVKIIAGESGGMMGVYNKDKKLAALIRAGESGGSMDVYNKDKKLAALITARESGGMMRVYNKNEKSVALMGVYKDNGIIAVYNKKGDTIGHLPQNYKNIKVTFRYIGIDDNENKEVINNFNILMGYIEKLKGAFNKMKKNM